jgi:HisA/HisF family protein
MQIVPVLDLKDGRVVRAVGGRRDAYRPIVSPLSPTSEPADVVAGFASLFPFSAFYVADLDAIEACGDNRDAILALTEAFPDVRFWVDAGADCARWPRAPQVAPVIGSESVRSIDALRALRREGNAILSLDFRGDDFLGPDALLASPREWPQRVIVMTLARVGSNAGPELNRLAELRRLSPGTQFFAAGGVRGAQDMEKLAAAGAAGALVASAMHDGALTAGDMEKFAAR